MPINNPYELKGVIPPKNADTQALLEALQDLQEFLRQFPGLGEEVMKARERERQKSQSSDSYRNEFSVGHCF